ncbi:solute carrier family 22 member 18 isoform X3 [Xenopus laevis]|uniref:Organic cation transporter-like protein 2 n=1 Tax=Xenopus laevis TaxID=8355 RepID=A0A8J1MUM4_XENLA|nr:solute carrier family 22 member 18 isoform X3 [Xenopus laevis]
MAMAPVTLRPVYLLAALDVSCLFMQFTVTPYLAKSLGLDTVGFGYLQTVFGILQLVGGPVFGRFSDQYGARAALVLSFLSGSLHFFILIFANNIPVLFLSRLPSVFMHGLPGAQMVVTDLTPVEERASALGKLGLCFGLGIITGSSLGGFLASRFGIYTPTWVALAANLLCCVIVMVSIPAETKRRQDRPSARPDTSESSGVFSLTELKRLLSIPNVMPVFMMKVLSGFPIGIFMIMFSVISVDFFGLNAASSGYLMSYFGILQLILMTGVFDFCLIAIPMVFTLCMAGVITDSILTKAVPPSDTGQSSCPGAILGICASVQPFTRTIGPTIGGYLYKHYGVPSFGCVNVIISLILVIYLLRDQVNQRKKK